MSQTNQQTSSVRDEIKVAGNQLVATIKDLIAKGNARSIIVRHGNRVVAELPLTAGVVGAVLAPQIAILGLLAALISQYTIEIRRNSEPPTEA